MEEVRTDRSIWKDIILWEAVAVMLIIIVGLLLGGVFLVGGILWILITGLILLALFIYLLVYWYKLANDLNTVCSNVLNDEEENSRNYVLVWFLSLITFGTYGLYWIYKQGNRLHNALEAYGVKSQETGTIYLLWGTVGRIVPFSGFVSDYLLIKNLNEACLRYEDGATDYTEGNAKIPSWNSQPGYKDDDVTRSVPVIVGIRGEYAGQELTVSQGEEIVMGRDAQIANLVFSSEKISKIHCRIRFDMKENCYYVTDYSKNGVTVDGGRHLENGKAERLARGSRIMLGDSEVFQLR